MHILLLGSGGREHALAWKIEKSPLCKKLFIAPGNAGTRLCGINVELNVLDFEAVKIFILEQSIDMVVAGPEEPLVRGMGDYLAQEVETADVLFVGPRQKGARLEGSKEFAKEFMNKYQIPTAAYQSFSTQTYDEGVAFLHKLQPPYVLKADGLAAGKGVVIVSSLDEAVSALRNMLHDKAFGKASEKVVIEEFLDGVEVSVFVATDGQSYIMLPEAKDYKRIGEKDTGLNTGGMGAVSPVWFADKDFMNKVETKIVKPTIEGLRKENIPYCGFLFLGLMNVKGEPYVVEYNVRLGDPETEVVVPRLMSDIVELMQHMARGTLKKYLPEITPDFAVTAMLVSGGYPGQYEKGKEIRGLEQISNSRVFFAGAQERNDKIYTSGGRVLAVTSIGNSLQGAISKTMENAGKIEFEKKYFRKDIGQDLLR